jgi:hypothetical protein
VKHWQDGEMLLRWVGAAVVRPPSGFAGGEATPTFALWSRGSIATSSTTTLTAEKRPRRNGDLARLPLRQPDCGIDNTSGATITATGNYWGAATGPGADPADTTCGDPVTATPAARAEIKVLVPPIR